MAKLRTLVVGFRSIGERHLRHAQRNGRTELAICEINSDLPEKVVQRYGIRATYSHPDAALTVPVDAAVICVLAHLHVPIATRLVETGIHVLFRDGALNS